MKLILIVEQKQKLEEQYKFYSNGAICQLIKAILLSNECWEQRQIVTTLLKHETISSGHLKTMSLLQNNDKPIDGNITIDFLNIRDTAYPTVTKRQILANSETAHPLKTVTLFLSQLNSVNQFLEQSRATNFPANNQVLTKKIKAKLSSVLSEA